MACMNSSCRVSTSIEWKKGWALRLGGFAHLCDSCGSAYEQSIFCEVFHSADSGWRQCTCCNKRLHCGCIVSKFNMQLLDSGGVKCVNCVKNPESLLAPNDDKTDGFGGSSKVSELQLTSSNVDKQKPVVDKPTPVHVSNHPEGIGLRHLLQSQYEGTNGFPHKLKQEDLLPSSLGDIGYSYFSNHNHESIGPSEATKPEFYKANLYDALPQTNLTMTIGNPLTIADERESKSASPFLQGGRSRSVLPKPPRSVIGTSLEANTISQIRVARPPAEGRGRNQLLPRYWPRITDQELEQISGDSNCTIVPLFEKMLSASDAGRIGRLVLPKACAEAYFPPISQPEGLPLKIQDAKGKEWVFQFRFWPNNNSRMYVLEGVTPCIQSMQLQAGDTVTFSRMDPEGKLIMGFRKASTSVAMQETHPSANSSEPFFTGAGVFENLPIISGYSGLLQSLKGSNDTHLNALSKHLSSSSANISWHSKIEGKSKEGLLTPSDRKRARTIGSKSKRLHIDSQDALEIRLTWQEAQDLLRPPPSVMPSMVVIEDHEFEEYEEPPVFGKRSISIVRSTGENEQWAQCDGCSKWRRLPIDVLLPHKWTCPDNAWDPSRGSCAAPDELTPREVENLLRMNKEFKRHKTTSNNRPAMENESPGLDALANAAILGDNVASASVATTTRHPRHRPGCSCIVCIQPPSGKGKHKPSCTCNVCMTVKRRFKTLMINKKKRQSEREAELAARAHKPEPDGALRIAPSENDASEMESAGASEAALDLNCDPTRDEAGRVSMVGLVQVASRPLEAYLKQNGLASLAVEQQQTSSASPAQIPDESEEQPSEHETGGVAAGDQGEADQSQNDPL